MMCQEVYSPPRLAKVARQFGLPGGWDLDSTTVDELENAWGFSNETMQRKAMRFVEATGPTLANGSPTCINFSIATNLNGKDMIEEEKRQRPIEAGTHLESCLKMHRKHHQSGRCFFHEHPLSATSWNDPSVTAVAGIDGVTRTRAHMCRYGGGTSGNQPDFSPNRRLRLKN